MCEFFNLFIWGCTTGVRVIFVFSFEDVPLVWEWFSFEDVPLVEFMDLVFACMPGMSYYRWFRSLLSMCDAFWALINFCCWFFVWRPLFLCLICLKGWHWSHHVSMIAFSTCSCRHRDGKRCVYSHVPDMFNLCKYAHSQEELDEWRERYEWRQLKRTLAREQNMFSYMDNLLEQYNSADSPITEVSCGLGVKGLTMFQVRMSGREVIFSDFPFFSSVKCF